MISMQFLLDAAKRQGVTIGHDGASAPLDVSELDAEPAVCICDGTGSVPILMDGACVGVAPCGACSHG